MDQGTVDLEVKNHRLDSQASGSRHPNAPGVGSVYFQKDIEERPKEGTGSNNSERLEPSEGG